MSTREPLIAHVRKGTSYRSRGQPAGMVVKPVLISMGGGGACYGLTHQRCRQTETHQEFSSCPLIEVVGRKPDLNRKLT